MFAFQKLPPEQKMAVETIINAMCPKGRYTTSY